MMKVAGLAVTAVLCACSSGSDAGAPRDGSGGATTREDSGTTGGAGGSGGKAASSGGVAPSTGGASGSGGDDDGGGAGDGGVPRVELPAGSRQENDVVNFVDAAAAAALDDEILNPKPLFLTLRHDFDTQVNLFLHYYEEDYDFVYLFTDHPLPPARVAGLFEPITRPAMPGGTSEYEIAAEGYRTTGRLKGVAAIQYTPGSPGPIAHETLHYWAADLDDRFGFGVGFDEASTHLSHWGYSSVNGQLGGFDETTLRCAKPAGASPPGCQAEANGRVRYVVGPFAPQTNTFRNVPYAALELYLMGLAPASEVPATFQMLDAALIKEESTDSTTVEAARVSTVKLSDIVARHGTPRILPASERHFRSAFVVISAEPASDAVMKEVGQFAAVWGARQKAVGWSSFEDHTLGRATMDTTLGPLRAVGARAPEPRPRKTCDPLEQDCERPELGCYMNGTAFCALSGKVAANQSCNAIFACAPGFDCVSAGGAQDPFVCNPYCDAKDSTSSESCAKLCPNEHFVFKTTAGEILGGLCHP